MKTWIYTIESDNSANPEVILFSSKEEMQERFVKDIIEDDIEGYPGNDPDNPSIDKLKALQEQRAPLEQRFAMAQDIYDASIKNNIGMPYYHGHTDTEGTDVPTGDTYTVILQYPDYFANEGGHPTWMGHVHASDAKEAVSVARGELMEELFKRLRENVINSGEDLYAIAVIAGHHNDLNQ